MEKPEVLQFPKKVPISNLPQPDMGFVPWPGKKKHPGDKAPTDWRKEADRRGKMVVGLVEERKLLQQLILTHCLRLEEYGFSCEVGPLAGCEDYQLLKSFAAGVGHIVMPLLEDMPLHGVRGVKRIVVEGEGKVVHAYLECGHTASIERADYDKMDPKPTINATLPCDICIELLKAKGIYKHEIKDA